MTDPRNARDITDGYPDRLFRDLDPSLRDAIVTLMARAAEQGYRRGFQQGESLCRRYPSMVRADLHAWRYGHSTDDSPSADAGQMDTSADRLFIENRHLIRLGLGCPLADAIVPPTRIDRTYDPRGKHRVSQTVLDARAAEWIGKAHREAAATVTVVSDSKARLFDSDFTADDEAW